MKVGDDFTLYWCGKHGNWWVTNCPDCMVDFNEPSIKKAGMQTVVDYMKRENLYIHPDQLKEWGIE